MDLQTLNGFLDGTTWFVAPRSADPRRGAPMIGGRTAANTGVLTGAALAKAIRFVEPAAVDALFREGFKPEWRLALPPVFERLHPFIACTFAAMMILPLEERLLVEHRLRTERPTLGWWVSPAGAPMPAVCLDRSERTEHIVGLIPRPEGYRIVRRLMPAGTLMQDLTVFREKLEAITPTSLIASIGDDESVTREMLERAALGSPVPPWVRAGWIAAAPGARAESIQTSGVHVSAADAIAYSDAIGRIVLVLRQWQGGVDRDGVEFLLRQTGAGAFRRIAELTLSAVSSALQARFRAHFTQIFLERAIERVIRSLAVRGVGILGDPPETPPHLGHFFAAGTEAVEALDPVEIIFGEAFSLITDWGRSRPFDAMVFARWGGRFTGVEATPLMRADAYDDLARAYAAHNADGRGGGR